MSHSQEGQVVSLPCAQLVPNPMQPRQFFHQEKLDDLATSIARHGVLQPLLVRPHGDHWQIIAGERRWRAAQLAGLDAIPCMVTHADDETSALQAMVENVQRQDLHYLEQARAIANILRNTPMTQEELASQLGMAPSSLANKLRLLRLDSACVTCLIDHQLSERHARALLSLESTDDRLQVLRHVVQHSLNVAQTERHIQRLLMQINTTHPTQRRNYIVKDVRLFLNTIDRSLRVMQDAGIDAQYGREDKEDAIYLTLRIPRSAKGQNAG
ncbi:ParB/RepB/Spo0J family partition protein [Bengtsoniella intestinalis]|uniref:ParB/RepB/Spo0J family partition protein n=1 Tax=Bengtsoniella intestinalis TaxID=3073143 RepID=UPI00391FC8A8